MKERKNTIDNVEFYSNRQSGNSIRQIDMAIQLLFKGYVVKVKDHWDFGKNEKANLLLFDRILDRLRFEHLNIINNNKIRIDRKNLELELL